MGKKSSAAEVSAPVREKRRFGMAPKLLLDVIQRQAGSLAKALLEGVMNSVDAKATRCDVFIRAESAGVKDDGTGISSRDAIENYFERFGQPHSEEEDKRYGTFRMGRGQMFAYGANTWKTGSFEMRVDVQRNGLDYELTTVPGATQGCEVHIDLYERLMPSALNETVELLRKWVKYAPIPVYVNEKLASVDPATEEWDHVLPEAYVKLKGGGSLSLYNLGIHTMDFGSYRFGVGGVIVSRQQLKVNFARNDVLSSCAVWKKIKPFIDQKGREKIAKKSRLSESEKYRLVSMITSGEVPENAQDLKMFTMADGRDWSAREIERRLWDYNTKVSSCPRGSAKGDAIHRSKTAMVFLDETLEMFDGEIETLLKTAGVLCRDGGTIMKNANVIPFKELAETLKGEAAIIPEDQWSVKETIWANILRGSANELMGWRNQDSRRVLIGVSNGAPAWTDGKTYIAFDRKYIESLSFDMRGIVKVGLLMAHMAAHEDYTGDKCMHDDAFYASQDEIMERLPSFVFYAHQRCATAVNAASKSHRKAILKDADAAEKAKEALSVMLDNVTSDEEKH
jgi:hypothetical protein